MSKLEDLLGKKKEIVPILDLSKTVVYSKDDYKRLLEKVPDFKMRPIKVRSEEIKIKEKDWTMKTPKKEFRYLLRHRGEHAKLYAYLDPIPIEMRSIVICDLCTVPIDWKMLTTNRPKTKLEEDFYSKIIEMKKLQIKTEHKNKRENVLNTAFRKVKNKSGIVETRILTCNECSEEFCDSQTCCDFSYDLYTRIANKGPAKSNTSQPGMTSANNIGAASNSQIKNVKKHKLSKFPKINKGKRFYKKQNSSG